jgi:hypothetical protein
MTFSGKGEAGVYPAAPCRVEHYYESAAVSEVLARAAAPAAAPAPSRIMARMARVQIPHCALQPQAA